MMFDDGPITAQEVSAMRRIYGRALALLIVASFALGWGAQVASPASVASAAPRVAMVHPFGECPGASVPCP
jgi:hypothetical protein